jgi:hypothetical protein
VIPVEGHSDLKRDPASGAIININKGNVAVIKAARRKAEERIQTLENDMSEIKDMLKTLLNKKK